MGGETGGIRICRDRTMACIKSRRRPCRKTRPVSGMSTCSTSPWQPSVVVSGGPSHSGGSRLVGLITASWDFVGRARPPPNERSRRTRGIRIRRKLGTPMPRLAVATEIRGSFPVLTGGVCEVRAIGGPKYWLAWPRLCGRVWAGAGPGLGGLFDPGPVSTALACAPSRAGW
jgi:hypothetical protein